MNGETAANRTDQTDSEAYEVLCNLARGKTGAIPVAWLARQALAAAQDGDWPVQRAALEALLRRCDFAKRDRLQIASRPATASVLGLYRTRRQGSTHRPYQTLLTAVEPLAGSCNCADFLRNSLGSCKHLLTIAQHVAARPRLLNRALRQQKSEPPTIALTWNPLRPLTGAGDWLERIALRDTVASSGVSETVFAPARDGLRPLRAGRATDTESRLALVEAAIALTKPGGRTARVAAEPAVHALLAAERDRLRHLSAELAPRQVSAALATMKQKPYPYQREGISRFLAAGSLLLADDMGLGKTAQAIASCHVLWSARRLQRGLLIVPASLKPQWAREWQSFTDVPITPVDGTPAERNALYRKTRKGFLLTNYELLLRDFEQITAWHPDLVVLDEAQRIKNWATKTALFVKRLDPRYRLVLTGTPMENRLDELASVFDWVDGFALEPKWRLAPWHTICADGANENRGARHLDTLRTRLAPSMIRRTRQEVLDQLPARTDSVVPVELTDAQRDEHDALNHPIAVLVSQARRRPLQQAEFLRLMSLLATQRIIANGLAQLNFADLWPGLSQARPEVALLQSLSAPKLLELREILGQILVEQGRKVVVFSQWRRMLQLANWAVGDILAAAGQRAVFFTGRESQKRRTHNLVDLHDDPATTVLFATDSGGVGLNLQKALSCCINLDLPWNPAVLEQRIGRIYRHGQTNPISVYNLVTQGSIEERIAGLIADKKALFSTLFEGSSDEVHFDRSTSFLSQLQRIVAAPAPPPPAEDDGDPIEEEPLARELDDLLDLSDEDVDEQRDREERSPGATPVPPTHREEARPQESPPAAGAVEIPRLFAQLRIQARPDGGLSIEAPAEAAAGLVALFEGMAKLLRAQAD